MFATTRSRPHGMHERGALRPWIIVSLVIAALLVAWAIFRWRATSNAVPTYMTTQVSRGTVARMVSATGTVNPQLTIVVGSYVSGVIQQIYCDFNTRVTKGQVCANIDPRPYQLVVDQATAALATARAQLVKDQAGLKYAESVLHRNTALAKDGYISRDVLDMAANAADQALASVTLDHASIRQREASLKAAQVNLEYTRIVSPVDGTVVSRNVTIGQTVAASFQTPTLFLIATDLTRMQVDTNVSESDIGELKPGDKAMFTVEAYPKREFAGGVTQIRQAPQTVQNVVTYNVIVSVDNNDLALMPGMTATTRIVTRQRDNVLRVPDQALRFTPTGTLRAHPSAAARVWVLRNGKPQPVQLTVGLDDDTYSEVVSGALKPGDKVIVGEQRSNESRASTPRFRLHM